MGSPCTWRRGDDRSITTAPVKTKRSEHVSSEESAEAFGSCIGFSTLCLRIDRHESVQWHVDVGQGAESSSYWGRDRLRKCQAWLFQGASKLPWGTSNQGTRAACCRRQGCVVGGPFVSSGPLTDPRSSYCVLRRCNRSSLPRSAHTPYAERGFVEREEGGQRGSEALIARIDRSIDLWVDCDRRMQAGNKIGVSVVASLRGGSGDGGKVLLAK